MATKVQGASGSPTPSFQEHYERSVAELQASWIDLLTSMGLAEERPLHLSRRLGLSSTLSWHLSRMIQASTPAEAAQYVRGSTSMGRLLDACARHGGGREQLRRVAAAQEAFEAMVATHAGDRKTLDAMLLGKEDPEDDKQREQVRKQAFHANSAICGVQARARVGTMILAPWGPEQTWTAASFGGLLSFKRLIPEVSWPATYLRGPYTVADAATTPDGPTRSLHLFEEFCSVPPSALRAKQEKDGVSYWLENDRLGLSGAVNYFSRVAAEEEILPEGNEEYIDLKTPVELLVFTVLFRRDMRPRRVTPFIYNRMQGSVALPLHQNKHLHLAFRPKLETFEHAPQGISTPTVPRHREMAERTCQWMGWDLEDFCGYRMVMRYPPIPTMPGIHWQI